VRIGRWGVSRGCGRACHEGTCGAVLGVGGEEEWWGKARRVWRLKAFE